MYANLKINYTTDAGEATEAYAWLIERDGNELVISLDDNDGESNYAVEAGTVRIDARDLNRVEASF